MQKIRKCLTSAKFPLICSHDTIHVVSGFQLMMNEGSRNSDTDGLMKVYLTFNVFFFNKVDESSRQREEINGLLSQVCDLQKRVQKYSHENDDLTANLRVYQVRICSRNTIICQNLQ